MIIENGTVRYFLLAICIYIHYVSKNVPPLVCYNFDTRERILIFCRRNITDEVGKQSKYALPPFYGRRMK